MRRAFNFTLILEESLFLGQDQNQCHQNNYIPPLHYLFLISVDDKAQASLEYLMTYGWMLILIATVVGVLVFIATPPADEVVFSSSDPAKIMLKSNNVRDNITTAVLQNVTGGELRITSVSASGGSYTGCTVNGEVAPVVFAGETMLLECPLSGTSPVGTVTIAYKDFANLDKEVIISIGGGVSETGTALLSLGESCNNGSECDSGNCPDLYGICCDEACEGGCQLCSAEGSCTITSNDDKCVCSYCDGANPDCAAIPSTSAWGSGQYNCPSANENGVLRCYYGDCVNCGGFYANDQCWYSYYPSMSCTNVCASINAGGCVPSTDEFFGDNCLYCKYNWGEDKYCESPSSLGYLPAFDGTNCIAGAISREYSCDAVAPTGITRICPCYK